MNKYYIINKKIENANTSWYYKNTQKKTYHNNHKNNKN